MVPYRDFGYSYMPLFLYTMLPFFEIGGTALASLPIVIADALSALVIYKIGTRVSTTQNALLAGMSYALLPFALVYEGYDWLGVQPMLLFVLLAVLLYSDGRYVLSAASLSVAISYKQEAAFLVPAYIGLLILREKKDSWKPIVVLVVILVMVSAPFLVLAPQSYLNQVSYGLLYNVAGHAPPPISSLSPSAPITLCNSPLTTSVSYYCLAIPDPILTFATNVEVWVGQIVAIPLLVMAVVILPFVKDRIDEIGPMLAISTVGFLVFFSYLVHELLTYYMLPAYALLLLSCKHKATPVLTVGLSTLALVSPPGLTQVFLASGSIVMVLALEDLAARSASQ